MGALQAIIIFIVGYIVIDKIDAIVSRIGDYPMFSSLIEKIFISPNANKKSKEQKFALYLLLICIVALVSFL